MRAGTVIRWKNFPEPRFDNEIKARWFVYLGRSESFAFPVFFHFCTTTTNLEAFQRKGKRHGHPHCLLSATDTPFDEDCVIDLREAPWSITEDELTGNDDIEFKGELSDDYLKKIYELAVRSPNLSKKVVLDIHRALNDIGITGLRLPRV